MILYVDILFLINFSMDFLSLYAAGRLLSRRLSVWRMSTAAAVGALYGTVAVAISLDGHLGAVLTALCSLALTAIAFGVDGVRDFLRTALAVWGSGALLGGSMTLLAGLFGGSLPGGGYADLCAAGAAFLLGIIRLCGRRMTRGYAEIRFSYANRPFTGRALIDSGNLLTDPLSGLPVVLMCASAARSFAGNEIDGRFSGVFSAEQPEMGVRAVPVHTIGGTRLLYGFLCPAMQIMHGRRTVTRRAVICIDWESDSFGGCGTLLPASLLL